jgi:two-component system sensor histidine kinase CpxA
MIQQLLGLARVETGMEVPTAPEIDLTSLVKEVTANANFEAIRANRTAQLLACGPSTIRGVKDVLRSAIENVARNAVVHTAEGTSVEISLTHLQDGNTPYALVSVRDHGQGVPPSLLSEIFRPFFSVGDSRTGKWGGVGLGLAIAERAVKLNGGSITAANHPDGGLLVEMRFPVTPSVRQYPIANQKTPTQGDHISRDY